MFFIETLHRDFAAEFGSRVQKYPRPLRLAVILGLSTALWGAIIIGGWGLYSLLLA